MVCSCGDICKSKGHCTCHVRCCICLESPKKNKCSSSLVPLRKSPVTGSVDKNLVCQCRHPVNKVARSHSATSLVTTADKAATRSAKLKDSESGKDPIIRSSSVPYSSFSKGESLITVNKQKTISSQGEPHKSRFDRLKLKLRKIRSSFKKQKDKNNFHRAILALEYGDETSDESSVETESSTDTIRSSSKRTKTRESLLQTSSKVENFSPSSSQADQKLEQAAFVKPFALTLKDETDACFKKQLSEPTEMTVAENQSFGNQSSLFSTDPLRIFGLSFSPLRIKLPLPGLRSTGNTVLPTSSNKSCNLRSSEDVKFSISYLKDFENSSIDQSPDTHRPTFLRGSSMTLKSASDVDKSLTESSNFQERSSSSHSRSSYLCARSLSTSLDETKNFKLLYSSNEIQPSSPCAISKATNTNLNRCPGPLMTSPTSSTRCELNSSNSCSLSRETLLCSPLATSSPSNRSLTTFPRSFSEFSSFEKIKINRSNFEDQNLPDAPNLLIVSSELSDDFEELDMISSPDCTDSESISSSEFLPCSYCRFVINTSLISNSVIPYQQLE